jgi:predicted branched-subunit amino acid permease
MIASATAVNRLAFRDAVGFPSITLLASMTGFGSLVHESGLPFAMAIAATVGIWGLPGQLALVEMHVAGLSAFFVILGVALANARFLPMVVSFMPLMNEAESKSRWDFALVQMLSINSWAAGLKRFPEIEKRSRRRYYIVFAVICMSAGTLGTVIGYFGVGFMPRPIALGLIFMNPLFFAVLLAGVQSRPSMIALVVGAPLGVMFHLVVPDLDLLLTGVVGGTLAFWVNSRLNLRGSEQ